jgi:hypothetical protein
LLMGDGAPGTPCVSNWALPHQQFSIARRS